MKQLGGCGTGVMVVGHQHSEMMAEFDKKSDYLDFSRSVCSLVEQGVYTPVAVWTLYGQAGL